MIVPPAPVGNAANDQARFDRETRANEDRTNFARLERERMIKRNFVRAMPNHFKQKLLQQDENATVQELCTLVRRKMIVNQLCPADDFARDAFSEVGTAVQENLINALTKLTQTQEAISTRLTELDKKVETEMNNFQQFRQNSNQNRSGHQNNAQNSSSDGQANNGSQNSNTDNQNNAQRNENWQNRGGQGGGRNNNNFRGRNRNRWRNNGNNQDNRRNNNNWGGNNNNSGGNNYGGRGGGGNNRYGRDFYDRNQGSDGRNSGPAWNQGNQGFSGGPPAGNFYQPWFPVQHVPYFQPTPVNCRNCGGPNHTERDCAVGNQNANRCAQVPIPMMQGGFSNQQKN